MTVRRPALLAVTALAVVALSLTAVVAVAPAVGAPPPEELCGVCGDGFEDAAAEAGVLLTVERGTATIAVRDDGSGHWTARVRVSESAADRLAANESLRERVVRESLDRRTVVDDPRNLRTSVEDRTLVVDFDAAGVAHRGVGGVVLVDMLDSRTRRAALRVDADELRIRGPNGTAVTRAPTGATVDGAAAVWRSDESSGGVNWGGHLAFAPSDGPLAQSATTVAIVGDGLALTDSTVVFLGIVPAFFLGGVLLALRQWGDEVPGVDPALAAKGIAGGGAVVALGGSLSLALSAGFDTAVTETVVAFSALYALVAACALALDRPAPRVALGWTLAAAALVAALTSVRSVVAFQTVLLSIPAALWFPLGRARGLDRALGRFVAVAVVVAPFGAAILYYPTGSALLALLGSLITTIPWAAATVLFGLPLYLLGRGLGESGEPADGAERTSRVSAD
ncbi:hypothetical protein [Halosimplex salinum]|uniref:hypothetical protein n=1 Tax=Halosimplex salinum TaxID=1710538 RepID=UPI0013DE3D8D|nr:hypothetical protein [Halosimplex salinum]